MTAVLELVLHTARKMSGTKNDISVLPFFVLHVIDLIIYQLSLSLLLFVVPRLPPSCLVLLNERLYTFNDCLIFMRECGAAIALTRLNILLLDLFLTYFAPCLHLLINYLS